MRLPPLLPVGLLLALACGKPTGDDDPAPEGQTAGDCDDDADNDGDGLFDCDDDGCTGSSVCDSGAGDDDADSGGGSYDNGRWPSDACLDDIEAGGDVPDDFRLPDQFGDTLRLYALCDHVVLVSFGAMWDGASQARAEQLQELYGWYEADGFIAVQIVFEDLDGDVPSGGELSQWADTHRVTFPVVSDPSQELFWEWGSSGAVPSEYLLAPGVEVVIADGYVSEADVQDLL